MRGAWLAASAALVWIPAAAQEAPDDGAPPTPPAAEGAVLPRTGIDTTAAGTGDPFGHLPVAAPAPDAAIAGAPEPTQLGPPRALRIAPMLTVSQQFTLGGLGGEAGRFITVIEPAVSVTDATQRVRVNLDYAPQAVIYDDHPNATEFSQALNGDVLGTVVPDWAYIDLRGQISQQALYGSLGPGNTVLGRADRVQDSSVSASPYFAREFGDGGRAQLGYDFLYSASTSQGGSRPLATQGFVLPGNYGDSWLATNRIFANYATGDLGRLHDRVAFDGSQYAGSGALRNAHRAIADDELSYALARWIGLVGDAGYEDLRYSGVPPFLYSGPTGAAGVRLTPDPTSTATIEYRYIDGVGGLFVQGSVQLAPHTRIFGGYSEGITTEQQDLQDALLAGATDPQGNPIEAQGGVPLLGSDNFAGAQNDVFRTSRLDATLLVQRDRNTITLSFEREEQRLVTSARPATASAGNNGYEVTADWMRDLRPGLTGFVAVSYGDRLPTGQGGLSERTVTASAGLTRQFSDTLSGFVTYDGTFLASSFAGRNLTQNAFVIGLQKRW